MRTCIINTTLLALCYSDMFQISKSHQRGLRLIHFHGENNISTTPTLVHFHSHYARLGTPSKYVGEE